jgi:hypothetical protein
VSSLQIKAVAGVRQPVDPCHYTLYKICFASHSIVVSSKVWSGSNLSLLNALSPGEAGSLGTIAYETE